MCEIVLNINDLFASVFIALFCAVWIEYLTVEGAIMEWYYKLLKKITPYLAKPLGHCQYCMGGQIALWSYLIIYWSEYSIYNGIKNIFFICLTIFLIDIFQKLITWSKN